MKFFKIFLIFILFLLNLSYAQTEFPGWPQTVVYDEALFRHPNRPIASNLDSNPDLEILFPSDFDSIYVWKYDSSRLPGWPLLSNPYGIFSYGSAIGDVDGDGQNDVVSLELERTTHIYKLFVYHQNGTIHDGFPAIVTQYTPCFDPAISDLDKDGKLETVIVPAHDSSIYVIDDDGEPLSGWPKQLPIGIKYEILTGPAATGDLDLDGNLDIVAVSSFHLWAWSSDGTPLPGFPVEGPEGWHLGAGSITHLVLSDLDLDGKLEVLESADNWPDWGGMLGVWRSNGEPMPGFPIFYDVEPTASPVACDIDKDGYKEIIWCTYYTTDYAGEPYPNIHVFRYDGTYQPGWPIIFEWNHHFRDPVVADINNDGWVEIILTDNALYNGMGRYYAYDRFGNLLPDYPKEIQGFASPPTLADVNLDDTLDLAMSTDIPSLSPDGTVYYVHLLNMHTPYNPYLILWGEQNHDNYNTNNTEFGLIFKRGDTNHDGVIDILDAIYLAKYLIKSGPPPYPKESGDANSNSKINLADVIYIVKYLFLAGPAP